MPVTACPCPYDPACMHAGKRQSMQVHGITSVDMSVELDKSNVLMLVSEGR